MSTTYRNLDDLMQSMGSETTPVEARLFRDHLINQGVLDWDTDHTGGTLSDDLSDDAWSVMMGDALTEFWNNEGPAIEALQEVAR